ncbi:MAG TPA: LysM peptidoglycan-binding domain-containing protein [Anaerolineales bacterium]|nr:LysM peptidoglycan-binding domain-containing protein [Anaerolineales bacterium]
MKRFSILVGGLLLLCFTLIPLSFVFAEGCTPTATTDCYTVLAGDNLTKIAKKFNTSASELIELNALKSDIIRIGQVLVVPSAGSTMASTAVSTVTAEPTDATSIEPFEVYYQVKSGETLEEIAEKFGTTVEQIMELNGLESPNVPADYYLLILATQQPQKPGLAGDPATNPNLTHFGLQPAQLPAGYEVMGYFTSDIEQVEFDFSAPVVYAQTYFNELQSEWLQVFLLDVRGADAFQLDANRTPEEIQAINATYANMYAEMGLGGSYFVYQIPIKPIGERQMFLRKDTIYYEQINWDAGYEPYQIYEVPSPDPIIDVDFISREDTVYVQAKGFLILVSITGDMEKPKTILSANPVPLAQILYEDLMLGFQQNTQ